MKAVTLKWTCILATIVSVMSVNSNFDHNEVDAGSGDGSDDFGDTDNTKWHSGATGYHDQGGGHDVNWNQPLNHNWNDFEDYGSADGALVSRPVPGLGAQPPHGPDPASNPTDEVGGGGIIIETADPIDIAENTRMCSDESYCLNGGICYIIVSTKQTLCQCPQTFKGERCEFNNFILPPVDGELVEPKRTPTVWDMIKHPIAIAVIVAASVLFIGLLITLLICCCRCIRKKDEGSYSLDSALNNPKVEYTKVQNSQEFYA